MQKTVRKLRIGSRLVLGSYAAGGATPEPIVWLKATPNCDFISEFVLDFLVFDQSEGRNEALGHNRRLGNPQYPLSNIHSFANSTEDSWFERTHDYDELPEIGSYRGGYAGGFLRDFEGYEIQSLIQPTFFVNGKRITSTIRLPTSHDIYGDDRFNLFSKKGIRAKATYPLTQKRGCGIQSHEFVEYWLANSGETFTRLVGRNGVMSTSVPNLSSGFRPVCTVNPDSLVEEGTGFYRVIPFGDSVPPANTEEELLAFLGLTQPLIAS